MQEQLPRRKKVRIAGYVILFTTQTMGKKDWQVGSNSEHINPPYRNNSLRRNKNIFFRLFLLKNSRLFIKFTFKWCTPMKKSQDT